MWNGTEYDFVDLHDKWDALFGGQPTDVGFDSTGIVEGSPLTYSHDITGYGVPVPTPVTEAWLELDFTNDVSDAVERWWGVIVWDNREYVEVGYDGSEWRDIGEVDNGQYDLVVGIDWLNDDGILDVTIDVTNPGWNAGTAYLDHSVLYGNVVPVPGAALLGVLGLGSAGAWLRKRFA